MPEPDVPHPLTSPTARPGEVGSAADHAAGGRAGDAGGDTRGAITVPALHRNVRGWAYPAAVWLLLRGGRKICKAGQACGRLTPFALPMSADDSWDLLTRPIS